MFSEEVYVLVGDMPVTFPDSSESDFDKIWGVYRYKSAAEGHKRYLETHYPNTKFVISHQYVEDLNM